MFDIITGCFLHGCIHMYNLSKNSVLEITDNCFLCIRNQDFLEVIFFDSKNG